MSPLKDVRNSRVIAFYLPQFHPIPENDKWWGKGFTEWTNVTKAKPLFYGHVQPNLPTEIGFYDLRVPETRIEQANIAREHGLGGFSYWHYWFGNGSRILERPFTEVLDSGSPDFPFCLTWANQSWTGTWHGLDKKILFQQSYPGEDDYINHFNLLLPAFRDPRYILVDGKPLFLIYNPAEIPSQADFVTLWRRLAAEAGLPGIYLVAMSNSKETSQFNCFDRLMMFGPADYIINQNRLKRALSRDLGPSINKKIPKQIGLPSRYNYKSVVEKALSYIPDVDRYIPCVTPNWDNTPRSGRNGVVFTGSNPELFQKYLEKALKMTAHHPAEERFVFVKAWNEWAEGNYLEPDQRFGRGWLQALQRAVS